MLLNKLVVGVVPYFPAFHFLMCTLTFYVTTLRFVMRQKHVAQAQ